MRPFFETLNYSSVNEDWRTEARALRLSDGERVLCVTGSGARPLDLLATVPARVVAVDCNPAQSALLALKRAAIEGLDYEDYARFIGLWPAPASARRHTLRRLRQALHPDVARYWERQLAAIARGVLYAGRWERFHRCVARAASVVYGRRVRTLLGFRELAAQQAWIDRCWDDATWRLAFDLACSGPLAALFADPAYRGRAVGPPGRYLHGRMGAVLRRVLACESFMVALALTGALPARDLPPHLTEAGHACLRRRLDALEIVTADIGAMLASRPRDRFDAFSLSDLGSFLPRARLDALLAASLAAARPRARIVLRQFLTRHDVPAALWPRLVRDPDLEALLAAQDRSFAYDFLIAEVRP